MPRFDWFQATISVSPQELGEGLLEALPGGYGFESGRGRNNYHHSMKVLDSGGETLATILYGGPNGDPHTIGTGQRADALADAVRRLWPEAHRPTRLDSCEDLRGDYRAIRDRCRELAAPSRVSGYEIAAHGPEKGSTDYLGAKTSAVQHRTYEKGKQMAALVRNPQEVPPDWVRLEVQWRPEKEAREVARTVTAAEVWGVSPWVRAIAREHFGLEVDRLRARPKELTDYEKRHRHLFRQYGAHLAEVLKREGSPEAFLEEMLRRIDAARRG